MPSPANHFTSLRRTRNSSGLMRPMPAARQMNVVRSRQKANANAEISEAEYGKLVEMVQGYPELADAAAEALWADFNVTRNEYVAIWRQWRTLCQQTGHNKRMLLHEIITADPDGWAARVDRESADAPITSPAPIPVEKTE